MSESDRRKSRRVQLRLPIALASARPERGADLWTHDVSAGGMYFQAMPATTFAEGQEVAFELTVPPGAGYSASPGTVKGSGKVVRTVAVPGRQLGVAVHFTQSLALEF